MLTETRISNIQPGDLWYLEGAWVTVHATDSAPYPDDRVRITYFQDGELNVETGYRGSEIAIVKSPIPSVSAPAPVPEKDDNAATFCGWCGEEIGLIHYGNQGEDDRWQPTPALGDDECEAHARFSGDDLPVYRHEPA